MQTPLYQRRARLTFEKSFEEEIARGDVTYISYASYVPDVMNMSPRKIIDSIRFCIEAFGKFEKYGPEGKNDMKRVEISREVQDAYDYITLAEEEIKQVMGVNSTRKVTREFGDTGLRFFSIGLGTIWLGRQWPIGNTSYTDPTSEEIQVFLDNAFTMMKNRDGIIMIDTAAAYGATEQRLGEYFRKNQYLLQNAFIATKWGEEFDVITGASAHDYSVNNLNRSIDRSLGYLGKVDLLYIHGTGSPDEVLGVLRDEQVIGEINRMKKEHYGGIRYIGVSISNPEVFEKAVQENLIEYFDVIQVPIWIYRSKRALLEEVRRKGKAIVINSPLRGSKDSSPETVYTSLLSDELVSMILTGTRYHLEETVGYSESNISFGQLGRRKTDL